MIHQDRFELPTFLLTPDEQCLGTRANSTKHSQEFDLPSSSIFSVSGNDLAGRKESDLSLEIICDEWKPIGR